MKHECYILGLGHPRTGTKFTAETLVSMNLDVGHEKMGADGIVAWPLVYPKGPWPWVSRTPYAGITPMRVVYNVRSPHRSIKSIVYTDDKTEKSGEWRKKNLDLPLRGEIDNRVEHAIISLLHFDQLIMARSPDLVYRIEDQDDLLVQMVRDDWVGSSKPLTDHRNPGVVNARNYYDEDDSLDEEFDSVGEYLKSQINDYCDRHGYPLLYP